MYFLACLRGLAISLYLLTKDADLISKPSNCRLKVGANLRDAMAYGGYAVGFLLPLLAIFCLLRRIFACHVSPFHV